MATKLFAYLSGRINPKLPIHSTTGFTYPSPPSAPGAPPWLCCCILYFNSSMLKPNPIFRGKCSAHTFYSIFLFIANIRDDLF